MSWRSLAQRFTDAGDDFNRGYRKGQKDFIDSLPDENELSGIVSMEIIHGARPEPHGEKVRRIVKRILARIVKGNK